MNVLICRYTQTAEGSQGLGDEAAFGKSRCFLGLRGCGLQDIFADGAESVFIRVHLWQIYLAVTDTTSGRAA
jgi:hypothetical protein